MPTYNFVNKETGEEYSLFMTMSELDTYLQDNPNITQTLTAPALVSGRSMQKPDKGFREILSDVKRRNPKGNVNDFGG